MMNMGCVSFNGVHGDRHGSEASKGLSYFLPRRLEESVS